MKGRVTSKIGTPVQAWLEQYSQLFWALNSDDSGFTNWFVEQTQMIVVCDEIPTATKKMISLIPAKSDGMAFISRSVRTEREIIRLC